MITQHEVDKLNEKIKILETSLRQLELLYHQVVIDNVKLNPNYKLDILARGGIKQPPKDYND
jgi:hypothetical protein